MANAQNVYLQYPNGTGTTRVGYNSIAEAAAFIKDNPGLQPFVLDVWGGLNDDSPVQFYGDSLAVTKITIDADNMDMPQLEFYSCTAIINGGNYYGHGLLHKNAYKPAISVVDAELTINSGNFYSNVSDDTSNNDNNTITVQGTKENSAKLIVNDGNITNVSTGENHYGIYANNADIELNGGTILYDATTGGGGISSDSQKFYEMTGKGKALFYTTAEDVNMLVMSEADLVAHTLIATNCSKHIYYGSKLDDATSATCSYCHTAFTPAAGIAKVFSYDDETKETWIIFTNDIDAYRNYTIASAKTESIQMALMADYTPAEPFTLDSGVEYIFCTYPTDATSVTFTPNADWNVDGMTLNINNVNIAASNADDGTPHTVFVSKNGTLSTMNCGIENLSIEKSDNSSGCINEGYITNYGVYAPDGVSLASLGDITQEGNCFYTDANHTQHISDAYSTYKYEGTLYAAKCNHNTISDICQYCSTAMTCKLELASGTVAYYKKVDVAINNASTKTATLTLLKDQTMSSYASVSPGTKLTIDAGGYTLSYNGTTPGIIARSGAAITFQNGIFAMGFQAEDGISTLMGDGNVLCTKNSETGEYTNAVKRSQLSTTFLEPFMMKACADIFTKHSYAPVDDENVPTCSVSGNPRPAYIIRGESNCEYCNHSGNVTENGLVYSISNATTPLSAVITAFSGTCAEEYTIPHTITVDGATYTVTAIANGVFQNQTTLKQVLVDGIGTGELIVGEHAFDGCTALEKFAPSNDYTMDGKILSAIGEYSFNNTNLESIELLESPIRQIPENAFSNNNNLCYTSINGDSLTYVNLTAWLNNTEFNIYSKGSLKNVTFKNKNCNGDTVADDDAMDVIEKLKNTEGHESGLVLKGGLTIPFTILVDIVTVTKLKVDETVEMLEKISKYINAITPDDEVNDGIFTYTKAEDEGEFNLYCYYVSGLTDAGQKTEGELTVPSTFTAQYKYPVSKKNNATSRVISEIKFLIPCKVVGINDDAFTKEDQEMVCSSMKVNCTKVTKTPIFKGNKSITSFNYDGDAPIVEIAASAFEGTGVTKPYIPANITAIGDKAFADCQLTDVYTCWATPVAASKNVFSDDTYNQAVLHTPNNADAESYATTEPWKYFTTSPCAKIVYKKDIVYTDSVYVKNGTIDIFGGSSMHQISVTPQMAKANTPLTVNYKKTWNTTYWQPFVMPCSFALTDDILQHFEFAELWDTFVNTTSKTVSAIEYCQLAEGDTLKANTPYLIKPLETGEQTLTMSTNGWETTTPVTGYDCTTTKQRFTFCGLYRQAGLAEIEQEGKQIYAISNEKLMKLSNKSILLPFTFYMIVENRDGSAISDAAAAKSFELTILDMSATSIRNVSDNTSNAEGEDIYTTTGQRLTTPRHGAINIIGGRKVLVK